MDVDPAPGRRPARHNLFELSLGAMARMGAAHQFRPLVAALSAHRDDSQRMVALQELSELLSMSTEDSLVGLDVGELAQALVGLARGGAAAAGSDDSAFVAANANTMLLACRCMANLLEALPLAAPVLLRHDAVPALCGRLLDIEYIDVAEQALAVLARLSADFPARVCEAGGMSACLMFLDFFAISTQRTALACAANCARAVTSDQFPHAAEAIPALERTAFHSDQKIAELSCSALLHMVAAFRSSPPQVEQLVSEDLLRRIAERIRPADAPAPAAASLTLLRVLAMVASVSRDRAAQLLDMGIIPILAAALSSSFGRPPEAPGPAPPRPAALHRPQHGSSTQVPEQAWEALRILVSILPRLPATPDALAHAEGLVARGISADFPAANDQLQRLREIHARPAVLQQLQDTLVPLMVHIFALTVNVSAQYRVLLVVLKAVFCLDAARLQAALDSVDLPPFIAGTVALLEAPILAAVSLLIIRIVHDKTRAQYARRFAREGVVDSLARLALAAEGLLERAACHASGHGTAGSTPWDSSDSSALSDASDKSSEGTNEAECGDGGGGDCGLLSGFALVSGAHIPSSARHGAISASQRPFFTADLPVSVGRNEAVPLLRWILAHARVLRGELDSAALAQGDCDILDQLQLLAARFADPNATRAALGASADALSVHLTSPLGVTCHELVHSGLVASLEGALARDDARDVVDRLLCHCVDGQPRSVSSSALGVLIGRLHEALGSSEALRVHEAYRSGSDETHSPAHMLSKQVRFAVSPAPADAARQAVADSAAARAMEQVRRRFLPIRVSVHAVATFSVLEAYLRPRIALLIRDSQRRLRRRRRHLAAAEGPSDTPDEETQTGGVRPHQAQLERLGSEAPDGSGTGSNSAQRKREQEHLRMLRMIAQASGIDLRAAALFDGLDLDMDLGDDAGGQEADSESDADDATTEDPPDADDARASAAAAAAAQQGDWHLRFVLRVGDAEREADASDNIFRAIHELWQRDPLLMNASPWAHTFELRFCVEFGPRSRTAPAEPLSDHTGTAPDGDDPGSVLGTEAASVVSLLGRLHGLLSSAPGTAGAPPELDRLFVNRKISAKAARQLGDPLMVVCSALPDWCHRLVARAPFLVAFDVRLAYMQATYFGYSRNINHWQVLARREQHGDDRAQAELQIPLGHVQRQKVRISRHRMLESALKVMDLYGTAKTILEVEYFDEVGSGIGPTLEFYSTVSRCLQERGLGLWRDEGRGSALEPECGRSADHVSAPHGLFPAPIGAPAGPHADSLSPDERAVQLFGFMGRLVAKCLIDGRILDIPFSAEFWAAVQRHLSGGPEADEAAAWTWRRLEALDPRLASSLQYLDGFVAAKRAVYAREGQSAAQTQAELDGIRGPDGKTSLEDLALEFTLPGHPSIELRAGGADVPVTISNVDAYISLVVRWTLHTGIRSQIAAFCEGFGRIFSPRSLLLFTPAELCSLAGQAPSDDAHWTRASLLDSIKVDHGFTLSSPEVHMFIDFLVSLDGAGRRQLLQFATGSPRLPLGGFRALHPPLTLVPRPATAPLTPDDYLPTVMTCANYIKLPLYSSPDVLARRWRHAMAEGQNSFHMS